MVESRYHPFTSLMSIKNKAPPHNGGECKEYKYKKSLKSKLHKWLGELFVCNMKCEYFLILSLTYFIHSLLQ